MARILVIDDDESLLATLGQLLAASGHIVATAGDGREGAKKFRAQPADLIFSDIFMPNQEGIETIIALHREFPSVAIIAMSGGHTLSKTCLAMAARLGARQTLAKPFTPAQLQDAINAALGAQAPIPPAPK